MTNNYYKVSLCTVCMNRLHHLKKTLIKNIQDNVSYPNLELVVLNYNSQDKLENWIRSNLCNYIDEGLLIYARTDVPKYFNRSHSKNVAFKIANGDIICNIDADNYTGNGFAFYVNNLFYHNRNSFLTTDYTGIRGRGRDAFGRLCCNKKDLISVGGYDEEMTDYGWEEIDLINRLKLMGKNEFFITEPKFLNVIKHGNLERFQFERFFNTVHSYFINYISPLKSEIICLYKNNRFEKGTLIPDVDTNTFRNMSIKEGLWIKGSWYIKKEKLVLETFNRKNEYQYYNSGKILIDGSDSENVFYWIMDKNMLFKIAYHHPVTTNYAKAKMNLNKKIINPNGNDFGKARLSVNFESNQRSTS